MHSRINVLISGHQSQCSTSNNVLTKKDTYDSRAAKSLFGHLNIPYSFDTISCLLENMFHLKTKKQHNMLQTIFLEAATLS